MWNAAGLRGFSQLDNSAFISRLLDSAVIAHEKAVRWGHEELDRKVLSKCRTEPGRSELMI